MSLPNNYEELVYAGVLGKLIGVYLGRPFEGFTNERIERELGEITGYVNGVNRPLVVTDDDISGTFTFLRALEDLEFNIPPEKRLNQITAADIGRTWLNYLIEERTVLWWGGMGNSTEHTAYLRLKHGVEAPLSGSIQMNGKVVAEQIGSQIFIDGWGMVAAGDPELAADLAAKAGSVSHDGEAVYGAQVVAAIEAAAFFESEINNLLDIAVKFIPKDCVIAKLISDVRQWYSLDGNWRKTFQRIQEKYGYDKYGGNCHMVPNHAIIIMALLYGEKDFSKSLLVANTAGWDTDCNSGNVGCILGILNGLSGIDPTELAGTGKWRGPIRDRLLLPTADGGRCITDALQETYRIVNHARVQNGLEKVFPKNGAKFHFSLEGSLQGFEDNKALGLISQSYNESEYEFQSSTRVTNDDSRLAINFNFIMADTIAGVSTATFMSHDTDMVGSYELLASPTIHSGQMMKASIVGNGKNSETLYCRLCAFAYASNGEINHFYSEFVELVKDQDVDIEWFVPETDGNPIGRVGLEILSKVPFGRGTVYLDSLSWEGTPNANLGRPSNEPFIYKEKKNYNPWWARAWVPGCSSLFPINRGESMRLIQNEGIGIAFQGSHDWVDYEMTALIRVHLAKNAGIVIRAGGMKRYYALLIGNNSQVKLIKFVGEKEVLATSSLIGELTDVHELKLRVAGNKISGSVDGGSQLEFTDSSLKAGAVGLLSEEGRVEFSNIRISPV